MAWKDIQISGKLYIGFGAVLLLTLASGWVSFNGLQNVSRRAENVADGEACKFYAQELATMRRDFSNSGDEKFAESIEKKCEQLSDALTEWKAGFRVQADRDAIDNAYVGATTYRDGFRKYHEAYRAMEKSLDILPVAAREAEDAVNTISGDGQRLVILLLQARREEKNYILRKDEKYAKSCTQTIEKFLAECERIASRGRGNGVRQYAQKAVEAAHTYQTNFNAYLQQESLCNELLTSNQNTNKEFRAGLDEIVKGQQAKLELDKSSARIASIAFILVALLIGTAVAYLIARGISRPVQEVVKATEYMNKEFREFESVLSAVANHDLTKEIKSTAHQKISVNSRDEIGLLIQSLEATLDLKDRLGASLSAMVTNLTAMIRQLSDNARELVSAATEISSSSEQMSKGAKDQSDQVDQVSTAVEEMSATILESSRNAGDASNASRNAASSALSGGQIVNDTIQGMQKIATVVRSSAESITKLSHSADHIGEIIGVIDDIADQTNLLALNAAIEAARAGEQGRGFAVVADEVRKLAERTGKATGEITEMIKGVQSETSDAVSSMQSGLHEVDQGRELADKAGSSLNEIVSMAQRVTDMIAQIATAAEQQSAAAEQISKNIEHISSVTKETATGAEQSAAAAEELNRQAEGLQQMVAKFKVSS